MIPDSILSLALIGMLMALFIWGRWRYDIVAFAGLIVAVALGLVAPGDAFSGFSHPATVTVAVVLVVSRGLSLSGAANYLAQHFTRLIRGTVSHIAILSGLAGVLSGFMNNVGALTLLMPVAIQSAIKEKRPVGRLLMPLSFASILGGLMTLIGTPPNIIIAGYREDALGESFAMFDFLPVGGLVALCGIVFVTLIGWRFLPERQGASDSSNLANLAEYVSELRVTKDSPVAGKTLREVESELLHGVDALVIGVVHSGRAKPAISPNTLIEGGDSLIVEARPDDLAQLVNQLKLKVAGARDGHEGMPDLEDVILVEAVVAPGSRVEGRSVEQLRFRRRYGVNLLAVSRQGKPHRGRMRSLQFRPGDVLLLQGDADQLPDVISRLGCWTLAAREMSFGSQRKAGLAVLLFTAAIGAVAAGLVPIAVALGAAALAMVLFRILPPREVYEGIDWPVIVLLGALIPIGTALNESGAAGLVAGLLVSGFEGLPPWILLLVVLVITMTLSDILNNAATAVVMAPVVVDVANGVGANPNPFLMAVAIGASCAFLTPIGHQNNALIMGPGGYAFSDYWRVGLPLEILIVAVAVPAILVVWPL